MTEPALPDKVERLDRALTDARIAHAFGGALALAYYAEPRSTVDIDLNLFVSADHCAEVTNAIAPIGVEARIDRQLVARDGQARVWWGHTPIDLFFAYDLIHDAMRDATRNVPFGNATIPILGPEHLVVCKVVFDRDKDWLDIGQVLASVEGFEVREVRRWLARLLAPNDARIARFNTLAGDVLGDAIT
jgi:hypothetical protein